MIRPLAWVWIGIVIGVSFLATPVKFTVESLTSPVALDVGRATFNALGYLELALTLTLAALIWRAVATRQRPSDRTLSAAAALGLLGFSAEPARIPQTPTRSAAEVNA
jgi:hypothetical protein